ncbi:tautomerase family protein [Enterovirga rhinocerotis]|uniref:4-oxalocrotonate tautomerase n=1 Tax=Enterovirga rhinocerotis TaxID=1339210 RepID=A0A4R7C795_9HYPH|nr:4-oxalocrotonate tautomerase [Enterovirga rhinocerotis]TDR93115.1 4-oxalocrotonate tautomerase [Enterovirga rhinocerotis]
MPMITLRYVTPAPTPSLRTAIAMEVPKLSCEHLGKDAGVTAILVEAADPDGWFVAGRKPVEDGKAAFWLDIKITAGTNTKAETTAFVRETFAAMERLIGPLHEESYILVHAVDGDAYGYGGRTQNGRWAAAHPG